MDTMVHSATGMHPGPSNRRQQRKCYRRLAVAGFACCCHAVLGDLQLLRKLVTERPVLLVCLHRCYTSSQPGAGLVEDAMRQWPHA